MPPQVAAALNARYAPGASVDLLTPFACERGADAAGFLRPLWGVWGYSAVGEPEDVAASGLAHAVLSGRVRSEEDATLLMRALHEGVAEAAGGGEGGEGGEPEALAVQPLEQLLRGELAAGWACGRAGGWTRTLPACAGAPRDASRFGEGEDCHNMYSALLGSGQCSAAAALQP